MWIFSQCSTLDVQEQNNDPVSCKKYSLSFQNLMELQGNLIIASDDNQPMINYGLYNDCFSFK